MFMAGTHISIKFVRFYLTKEIIWEKMKYLIDLCHLLNFNGQKLMYLDIEVLILSNKKRLTNHDWSIYLHVCDRKLVIIDIDQNTIFSLYKVFLLCEIRKNDKFSITYM
jgi:hypothetical protein